MGCKAQNAAIAQLSRVFATQQTARGRRCTRRADSCRDSLAVLLPDVILARIAGGAFAPVKVYQPRFARLISKNSSDSCMTARAKASGRCLDPSESSLTRKRFIGVSANKREKSWAVSRSRAIVEGSATESYLQRWFETARLLKVFWGLIPRRVWWLC